MAVEAQILRDHDISKSVISTMLKAWRAASRKGLVLNKEGTHQLVGVLGIPSQEFSQEKITSLQRS